MAYLASSPSYAAALKQSYRVLGNTYKNGVVATVFGATGMIGSYVVSSLKEAGVQIVVPFRGEEYDIRDLRVAANLGQVVPVPFDIRNQESIENAVSRSNVVINLLGKRHSTRNYSFKEANYDSAVSIAEAAKKMRVDRFIQLSIVGCETDSQSEYLKSKAYAEQAIRKILPSSIIIRSTDVYSPTDYLTQRISRMARYWYYFPRLCGAGRLQPISIFDLDQAIMKVLTEDEADGKTFEVAGPEIFTHDQFVDQLLSFIQIQKDIRSIYITPEHAKMVTKFSQLLGKTPFLSQDEILFRLQDIVLPNPLRHPGLLELDIQPIFFDTVESNLTQYKLPTPIQSAIQF